MSLDKRWPVRYGLAVLAALAAVWLRWALEPLIGTSAAFITVFPTMMLMAVTLGAGPGLVSAAVGGALVEWFFVGPVGIEIDRAFVVRAAILLSTSAYVGWISTRLRAARAKADTETATARAAEAALRRQVELIDPARAEIIASEMQRLVRDRERAAAAPAATTGDWLRHMPTLAGVAVAVTGLLVLLGWAYGVDALKSVVPGLATMKANTAVCFLLSGVALILRGLFAHKIPDREGVPLPPTAVEIPPATGAERLPVPALLSQLCAWLICAVAGLTLAEYVTGLNFGIDQLLFCDAPDANTVYLGRMAPVTALCFALSGVSLLLLKTRRWLWAQQAMALAIGLFGLTGLLGYAYALKSLYQLAGPTSVALHTATGLVVLATGLLFAQTDGLVRVLMVAGPGRQLARRFLPVAFLLPLLLGWLQELGDQSGVLAPTVSAGLFVLMMMVSLLAAIWWIASILNRTDADRRETEAQLRHQSELMDHADEGLIVRELGGVIRFWNQGAAALYGWSATEAIGQRTYVLLRTEGVAVTEKDAQLTRTGHWEGELVHTTRDGRRVTVESRQTATHAADGHLLVLEADRDITDRKQAEEALRMNEERLRFALETIHTGAWDLDLVDHTSYRSIEHDRIFGYADLLPQWTYEMFLGHVLPEDWEAVDGKFKFAMEHQSDWNFECRIRRADGHVRWILAAGRHRADASGSPRRMAGIVQDITDRKQAEEALRKSNEELSRFNDIAVGRELRVIELKRQVNDLFAQLGHPPPYPLEFEEEAAP